jgi:GT2 family glycosyltransferase
MMRQFAEELPRTGDSSSRDDIARDAVDVVILSWHRTADTVEAVHSVLGQRGVQPQVWLVDQGSGVDALLVLRTLADRHPEVHLVSLGHNVGVPAGRNIGSQLGTAPVIVGLDNDAVLDGPDVLKLVLVRFRESPSLGALAFRILDRATGLDDELAWVHPRSRSPHRPFPAARFCGAAHALRRAAFESCRGYDEALFFYWEETDLSRRLLDRGYGIEYMPTARAFHSLSAEARLSWRGGRYYYCVRNRLYVEHRYGLSHASLVTLALGYVVKGCRNGLASEGIRGVAAAIRLSAQQRHNRPRTSLLPSTRAYLREREGFHGNSLIEQCRAALSRLPPDPAS